MLGVCIAAINISVAQNYFTKNGMISFYSKSPLENITAVSNQVVSVINTTTGETRFSVTINGFKFRKALMQVHFNENYMESEKYPKAIFAGTITNPGSVAFTKDGEYKASVSGDLTMHGVTKKITAPTVITVKGGKFDGNSTFTVLLADYNISIPAVVADKINKAIAVTIIIPAYELLGAK